MKRHFLFLLFLTGLYGCNFPTELPVAEGAKPADKFARSFIDKIISGQLESCFADIDSQVLNDKGREFIANTSHNINGATIKKYRVVEQNWTSGFFTKTGKFTNYRLAYEYEFEKGNILFTMVVNEKDGKFSVTTFNGQLLPAPLADLTRFTLEGKSITHYVFLIFTILIPFFILTTLIIMLLSKMTIKTKIIWAIIILFVALPQFIINWGDGNIDFKLLQLNLFGCGFNKPNLYTPWLIFFNIPIGAIVFWFRRKSLLPEVIMTDTEPQEIADNANSSDIVNNT